MLEITPNAFEYISQHTDNRLRHELEVLKSDQAHYPTCTLSAKDEALTLILPAEIAKTPFQIDFSQYIKRLHRIQHHQWQGEYLVQMLGKTTKKKVVDATAGFGRDSFLLAAAQHEIIAFEENPIIGIMILDALSRPYQDIRLRETCARIHFHPRALATPSQPVDAIYIDPMFVSNKKNKLKTEKYAQVLQYLNDDRSETHTTLSALLGTAISWQPDEIIIKQSRQDPNNISEILKAYENNALSQSYQLRQEKTGGGFKLTMLRKVS